MACPFFNPTEPYSWHAWPNPPRMPLGDPYAGICAVRDDQVPDARLRTCCNTGYARGACPNFPGGDAPDTVRFGIVERKGGAFTIRYVVERDHRPFGHGMLVLQEKALQEKALPETTHSDGELIERQARAFLNSYLRREETH